MIDLMNLADSLMKAAGFEIPKKRNTIKDKKEQMRRIIDRYRYHVEFSPEDTQRIRELTGRTDIVRVRKAINPDYPSDTRHLHIESEIVHEWQSFSWNKAISPLTLESKIKKVLRDEVQYQIDYFKFNAVQKCNNCGSTDHITVDHKSVSFDDMATDFMRLNVCKIKHKANGVGYEMESRMVRRDWLKYHKETADYQILCRSCNASKGKKKAPKENGANC